MSDSGPERARIAVYGPDEPLTRRLARELAAAGEGGAAGAAAVYAPSRGGPDLAEAEAVFAELARHEPSAVVVLSSSEVHEPHHHHLGMVEEARLARRLRRNPRARRWLDLERLAAERLGSPAGRSPHLPLTVLRPAPVPLPGARDPWSRLLSGRFAASITGYDPSIQLLAFEDLVDAVLRAIDAAGRGDRGIFQIAPASVVPLSRALRLAGARRLPVPRWGRRVVRAVTARAAAAGWPDYLRYSWTASGERAEAVLGFVPRRSSAEAALALRGDRSAGPSPRTRARPPDPSPSPDTAHLDELRWDDWGMDPGYIARHGRGLFRFLHDAYWRVEVRGLEHVPREGRAVLVGVHRGFMPFDGVMALHLLVRETGRYPRFLLHPTLAKFPFLCAFMHRLGGVPACRENADRILARDGIVAIFPEGIRGAFTPYRRAYRLGKFGRDEFVKTALRNRAPIVPFVTVGSAEIFPIVARFDWGWWKRYSEWPYFPVAPPFPPLPVPLPSKWHTRYLEPLDVTAHCGPEAAGDAGRVKAISDEVRRRMEEAIASMLARRRSVFYGSVFDDEDSVP